MSKYDDKLNVESAHHRDALLMDRIKPNSIVLEFGPAHGKMTKYLKEVKNCKVYAVEIDSTCVANCKDYCEEIVNSSIEEYTWQRAFKKLKFDYIIFADVLEHLLDPWKVLAEVKCFLKNEGKILISIPNIAHNAIIISLINNEFNYQQTGLLDRTHIRFFTKKTIDKMVEDCGYFVSYLSAYYMKPIHTEFKSEITNHEQGVVDLLCNREYANAYVFIYELYVNSKVEIIPEIDLEEKNTVQLFIDTGDGFNSKQLYTIWAKNNGKFDLNNEQKIYQMRFDPSIQSCVVKVNNLYVIDKNNNQYPCRITNTNANFNYNGEYIFYTDDPQITVDVPINTIDKFIFEIEYKNINLAKSYFLNQDNYLVNIQSNIAVNKLLEQQIEISNQLIKQKDTIIASMKVEIENNRQNFEKFIIAKSFRNKLYRFIKKIVWKLK